MVSQNLPYCYVHPSVRGLFGTLGRIQATEAHRTGFQYRAYHLPDK